MNHHNKQVSSYGVKSCVFFSDQMSKEIGYYLQHQEHMKVVEMFVVLIVEFNTYHVRKNSRNPFGSLESRRIEQCFSLLDSL